MSGIIGEPFVLTSYPTASQKSAHSHQSESHKRSHHIGATCSTKSNGEGFVTISVQGDGIHVVELSSMHASVSHTLGPSAFFAAPAVTRFGSSGASTSYAVMQSASDGVDSEERARTVWRWCDQESRRTEDLMEPKLKSVFPHPVEHIWAPSALPSHVVAVSPLGQIMLADQDLKGISSGPTPNAGGVLFRSWLFTCEECKFIGHGNNSDGVVVLCFMLDSDRLKLRLSFVPPTGELTESIECDMGCYEDVIDISCDPSGYTSALTQTGEWKVFRIAHEKGSTTITATPLPETLHLSGFIFDERSRSGALKSNGPTLLSAGTSHVLLAGIVDGASPEIALLLWDLQYSVVLSSQIMSIPSTLIHTSKSPFILELVSATETQALLLVSPAVQTGSRHKENTAQNRSTVFLVQLEVPSVSTIALAMGKARDTQRWLQNTHSPTNMEPDEGRARMMESVQSAMEQDLPQAADAAFFSWLEEETIRFDEAKAKEFLADDDESRPGEGGTGTRKAIRKTGVGRRTSKTKHSKPILSHYFVSLMLNMILRPEVTSESPYSPRIVLYLLDRNAVGNAMVEGGLLPALRKRRDWESVYSALKNVPDIPEADLISLLADVVMFHRQQHNPLENGMEIDTFVDIPPLSQFLAALVGYATSPPMLRLALKHHLADVRDITCVLEVLEGWVTQWNLEMSAVTPSSLPTRKQATPSPNEMPTLENIVYFLQNVLDTHFVALLQYFASHDMVERLARHVKQQLTTVDEMGQLQGPLEFFIQSVEKEAHFNAAQKQGKGNLRRKRKGAAGLAVGLYQIEQLVM